VTTGVAVGAAAVGLGAGEGVGEKVGEEVGVAAGELHAITRNVMNPTLTPFGKRIMWWTLINRWRNVHHYQAA
jgi:hypothetical protein